MKGGHRFMPIYSQADRQPTYLDEAANVLIKSKYLTESESTYYPEMVPIREDSSTGKLIVRLEDLVEYSGNNGINEASAAVTQVCTASKVDVDRLAFSIDETSVLENTQYEDTARAFAANSKVFVVPVSETSASYMLAESCLKTMDQAVRAGETQFADALFEAYINDEFEYLENEVFQSNLSDRFTEHAAISAINESNDNMLHWTAEKISSLRSLSRQYLDENSEFAAKFRKGIDYLGDYLKEVR